MPTQVADGVYGIEFELFDSGVGTVYLFDDEEPALVDAGTAASALVEAASDLDIYIHEMTASHLVDPGGLTESSRRAMGEHFESMGEQGPVPEATVVPVSNDGTTVDIGANRLELIHAPGHSPDHFAVWNPERELHRFDERILELHEEHGSREATKRAVAAELVDASPPYDEDVESFYASLVTDGFLKHHGIE